MELTQIKFTLALPAEADEIVKLVNDTYRGETSRTGWTTEADLLEGLRTELTEILCMIQSDRQDILTARLGNQLIGSMHLTRKIPTVHIGMFAVNPAFQNQGIGKAMLQEAERLSLNQWKCKRLLMAVIPFRHELIAYYERRGFRLTGETHPFPCNPKLWTPKVDNLSLAIMEKTIAS